MTKLILDTPYRDSFPDFLEKGETIIWEGQPSLKSEATSDEYEKYMKFSFWGIIVIAICAMILTGVSMFITGTLIIAVIIFKVLPYLFFFNKKKFNYAITQKQILFEISKKEIHTIPFADIKDIILVLSYDLEKIEADYREAEQPVPEFYRKEGIEKIGTIFLVPHQPDSINFDTINLQDNERRHLPTLELLDDAAAVAKMIKERI